MNKELKYPTVKLRITGVYPDFATYYSSSKITVYKKILEVFRNMSTSEDTRTRLTVVGNVNYVEFDSNFFFEKSKPEILIDVINPFFELMEDYETCNEVIEVYNSIYSLIVN